MAYVVIVLAVKPEPVAVRDEPTFPEAGERVRVGGPACP